MSDRHLSSAERATRRSGGRPVLGLALVTLAAPLALGGTRPALMVTLSAGVALAALWWGFTRRDEAARWPWTLWAPAALVALGVAQCIPLPEGVRALLAPSAMALAPPGWAPLSLDPPATVVATLHQAAFALAAVVALDARHRGRRLLLWALAGGAAVIAVLGLVHWLAGFDRLLGVLPAWDRAALTGYVSVFVNPNTLAGYLTLGAMTGLGLTAGARAARTRRRAALVTLLAAGGAVLTGSRGGQGALLLGALIFTALAIYHRADAGAPARGRARFVAAVALLGCLVGVVAAVIMLPEWGARLAEDGRVAIWRDTLGCLGDHWRVGAGRGAFAAVYPQCQTMAIDGTVSHPETIGLQLAVEWGALGAAVALVGGGLAWVVAARRARSAFRPVSWGLVAGLAAVGAQQLVDFGLEAMGLSIPVAVALGLALGGRHAPIDSEPRLWVRPLVLTLAGLLALLAALVGWSAAGHRADAEARAVLAEGTPEAVERRAAEAHARHPADYYIPLIAAARLAETGGSLPAVFGWLNRSFERAPAIGQHHLLAARVLLAAGRPAQAAGEYRQAITATPWDEPRLVREVARRLSDPVQMSAAVPAEERAWRRLGEVLLAGGRVAEARAAMEAVLLLHDTAQAARIIRGRACLADGDDRCLDGEADWLIAHERAAAGHGLRARRALRRGEVERARAEVEAARAAAPDDAATWRLTAEVAGGLGEMDAARQAYSTLWQKVGARPVEAAAVLAAWGRLELRRGDATRGRRMLEQAAGLDRQYADEARAAIERAAERAAESADR